ncbi:helix-turn-helix domain-containing protein [Edaphobacter sp. HDX4]|uniref:helix-turn-helix domain-containing protein n=1 Tax=Edaphobacter sp. HDX4 TaxID=2794064 RepID=UPI002FE5DBD2
MSTMLAPPLRESSEMTEFVEAHVQRMLQSSHLARAETQRRLLLYLWEHRNENVSEYALATEALGRNANFDPTTDASVRVHISRLRRKLKDYYQLEPGEPELLVIPTGTHQLMVLDQALQSSPVVEEVEPIAAETVGRSYTVPILLGIIAVLLVAVTWLGWNYSRVRAVPERPKPNAFWSSFLAGTAPIRIILPTPVFFGFTDHPTLRLRSTSVNDFNDVPKDPEFDRLIKVLGKRTFEQSYTVTWDTLAAIDMARYLDGVGAKDRVSFNVTRDLSPLFLENSNVIAVGTHQTLQPLAGYLQAMNFSLAPAELRVTNANPRPGEQGTYEIVRKNRYREVRPSILAVLPGRAPGLKVMLLQSRDTGALVSLISSSVGSNSIEAMWKKEGSPQYFEMVTYTELESNRPLRTWPVAIHTFTAKIPENSM